MYLRFGSNNMYMHNYTYVCVYRAMVLSEQIPICYDALTYV